MNKIFNIIEEITLLLSEGECIDADGNRQLTLSIPNNPNNRNFQEEGVQRKAKEKKQKRSEAAIKGAEKRKLNKEKKANEQKNALGLEFKDQSEALIIIEKFINELSDELVNKVDDIRIENVRNAQNKDELIKANDKLKNNIKLMNDRDHRKEKKKEAIKKFREFLDGYSVSNKDIQKAGDEHADAQISQGLRNRLEKIYALDSLVEEYINEVTSVLRKRAAVSSLPGRKEKLKKAINLFARIANKLENSVEHSGTMPQSQIKAANKVAQKVDSTENRVKHAQQVLKEDSKPANFRKAQIAKIVNDMMMSGETDSIRQTPNGDIIGAADVVNKLKALKKERQDIDKSEENDG